MLYLLLLTVALGTQATDCSGLGCRACLEVPDYGCSFCDGACYKGGSEPMTTKSFAYTTADCPKEKAVGGGTFQAITDDTCEDAGMENIKSDDECKRALEAMDKSASWAKQMSSTTRYKGCFTAAGSGKSYFVYDARSSKYANSDPASTVKAGTIPRKRASADFTYYCFKEEEEQQPPQPATPPPPCSLNSCLETCWSPEGKKPRCKVGSNSGCKDAKKRGQRTYEESLIACRGATVVWHDALFNETGSKSTHYLLKALAFLGMGTLFYGAGMHFFGNKAEYHTIITEV